MYMYLYMDVYITALFLLMVKGWRVLKISRIYEPFFLKKYDYSHEINRRLQIYCKSCYPQHSVTLGRTEAFV